MDTQTKTENIKINTDILKPMAFACTGFGAWAICDALVRLLRDYPSMLISCFTSMIIVCILCVFSRKLGGFHATFTRPQLGMRVLRGVILAIPGVMSFIAFMNLELPTAYAIIFLAPFYAKILSAIFLKEHIPLRSWLITLLGFVGVLIALRPGMVPLNIGAMAALGLGVFFAAGYVLGRYIGTENQTPLSLAFFTYLFIAVGTSYPAYNAYQAMPPEWMFSWFEVAAIMSIGCLGVTGSLLVGKAYASAPSTYIAPIHYTQMVWGIILGAVMFGEYPDLWTLVGGGIIIFAGLLLLRSSKGA